MYPKRAPCTYRTANRVIINIGNSRPCYYTAGNSSAYAILLNCVGTSTAHSIKKTKKTPIPFCAIIIFFIYFLSFPCYYFDFGKYTLHFHLHKKHKQRNAEYLPKVFQSTINQTINQVHPFVTKPQTFNLCMIHLPY